MLAFLAQDLLWHHIDLISCVHLYVGIAFLLSYHRYLSPHSVHLHIARPVTTAYHLLCIFRNHGRLYIRHCSRPRSLDLGSASVSEQEADIDLVL